MADVFVSYARADMARVRPLVVALQAEGWSVWWDPEIAPGQEFDRLIADELASARAVVVVWTRTSVDSRWVRGEAREAADRGVLVPVRFDGARLPLDVRSMHTTDLDHCQEDRTCDEFKQLCRALRALLKEKDEAARPAAAATKPAIVAGRLGGMKFASYVGAAAGALGAALQPLWRRALPFAGTLVLGAVLAGGYVASQRPVAAPVESAAAPQVSRFVITPPASACRAAAATSRSGRRTGARSTTDAVMPSWPWPSRPAPSSRSRHRDRCSRAGICKARRARLRRRARRPFSDDPCPATRTREPRPRASS